MRLRDRACGSLSPKLEDSSVLPSHRKRSRRRKSRRLEAGGSVAGGSSEGRHRQALLLSGVAFGLAAAAALRHSRPASPHSVTLIRREERVCVFAFAPFPPLLIFSTDILRSSPDSGQVLSRRCFCQRIGIPVIRNYGCEKLVRNAATRSEGRASFGARGRRARARRHHDVIRADFRAAFGGDLEGRPPRPPRAPRPAGLNIRSTGILDTSYLYFGLVLGCIDADLYK